MEAPLAVEIVVGVVALAGLLVAAGVVFQRICETADLRRHPPGGAMVDIGGRRLHLVCAGEVRPPTVVFEAGAGNDSTLWHEMTVRVSAFARACTYDRAGLGWSDPAPPGRTFDDRVTDLHTLLARAGVPGPYILVGHSYGGNIVRRFAARYPEEVAGIVLIDTSDEAFSLAPEGLADAKAIGARDRRMGWMVRLGLLRLGVRLFPARFDPVRGVPPGVRDEMMALALRSSRYFERSDEMGSYLRVPSAELEARRSKHLGALPLAVVSQAPGQPYWDAVQQRLTKLSTASTHFVAANSGHMIQFSEPEVIVQAIRRVIEQAAG